MATQERESEEEQADRGDEQEELVQGPTDIVQPLDRQQREPEHEAEDAADPAERRGLGDPGLFRG